MVRFTQFHFAVASYFVITRPRCLQRLAGVINAVGVHPFISGKVLDPELRSWGFGAYCNERYPNDVANLQHLFRDEFDAMFAGLA